MQPKSQYWIWMALKDGLKLTLDCARYYHPGTTAHDIVLVVLGAIERANGK
jgi:hypothetical protein